MPSSNKPTRSTRTTRSTSQASNTVDEEINSTPQKASRKRGAARTADSSTRPIPQTPVSSSAAARASSSTPRGLVHSPVTLRNIEGGSMPEESLSQPYYSMEESIEGSNVREPAEKALGAMLSDGESGSLLTKSQKKAYKTFENVLKSQFGTSDFLHAQTLPDNYASALSVSTSPFASLIKLANLTSFLHLVLSSGPDPQNKKRPKEYAGNLKKASLELMKTVVPEKDQIDERILRLVVDLKVHAYLATSATSSIEPRSFFQDPLPSHRPSNTGSLSLDLKAKYREMIDEALNLIEESGGDRSALETKWKWNEFATRCKEWARERATGSPLGIEEEPEDMVQPSEGSVERETSRETSNDPKSDEERISQGSNQFQTNDIEDETPPAVDMEDNQPLPSDNEEESGHEASARGDEQDQEEDEQEEEEPNRSQATSRSPSKSLGSSGSQDAHRSDELSGNENFVPHAQDDDSDDDSELEELDYNDGTAYVQHLQGGQDSRSSQIALDQSEAPRSKATSNDKQQVDNSSAAPYEGERRSTEQAENKERLRIDRNHTLKKVKTGPGKSSILDRQEDAVRIQFDSQPEVEPTGASSRKHSLQEIEADMTSDVSKSRRKKGKKLSVEHVSPPAAGPSRNGNDFDTDDQDHSESVASRSIKRLTASPIERNPSPQQRSSPEPEPEYGGGFDDDNDVQTGVRQASSFRPSPITAGVPQQSFPGFDSGFDSNFGAPRSIPRASNSANQPRASTSNSQSRRLPSSSSKVPAKKILRREPANDDDFDSVSEDEQSEDGEEEEEEEEVEENGRLLDQTASLKSRKGKERAVEGRSSARPNHSDPFERREAIAPKRRREEEEAKEAKRQAKESKKRRMEREETAASKERQERTAARIGEEQEEAGMPTIAGVGNKYFQNRNGGGGRINWTLEETELLHELLKKHGADWKKMIKLHGVGGIKSTVFANRTNVSLKDKAVNIKKNLIKSGQPVPAHLNHVTVSSSKLQPPTSRAPVNNETDEEDD